GRGKSTAPDRGYALEDHIGDLAAAVAHLKLERFCLIAFSRGVSYVLGYALRHPERVAGLVVGDYPPVHTALPAGMPEQFMHTTWRGRAARDRMTLETVRAIQAESVHRSFVDELPRLACPVLVLHGAGEHGALLPPSGVAQYLAHLPTAEAKLLAD